LSLKNRNGAWRTDNTVDTEAAETIRLNIIDTETTVRYFMYIETSLQGGGEGSYQ